jgi:PleD family two-component response regulator
VEITKVSVLFLAKDLVFFSRVAGVAQSRQIELSVVSEADQLLTNTSANQVKLVLLDLTTSRCDPKQLVPQLRRLARTPKAVVAFGPHVNKAKLAAAEEAGCDQVLSRGEFNNRMTEVLVKYVAVGGQIADKAKASD